MTLATTRMMDSVPDYYQYSEVFRQIQQAQGDEYDSMEDRNDDLQRQLYVVTATWGLRYWEQSLGITIVETDDYEIRRSRVLSATRGAGNFSASLIKSVAESFANGEVAVTVDFPTLTVKIEFVGVNGIPSNIADLQIAIDNIIHAHLGVEYRFKYVYWDALEASIPTFNALDTYTWNSFGD